MRFRDEEGVAVIVVLLAVVILSALGASLAISSIRDLDTTTSVRRASSALALAEAGVSHAMEMLKNGQPLPQPLSTVLPDQSPDGRGQWMHPSCALDLSDPVNAAACEAGPLAYVAGDPARPGPYVGVPSGSDGQYTAFIAVETAVNVEARTEGFYRIVSTGMDRRNSATRPGVSTVWQDVRIQALEIPFTMFAEFDYRVGGQNVVLRNLSAYTGRDMLFRDSLTFQATPAGFSNPCPVAWPTGCDLMYLHDRDAEGLLYGKETGPAAAHSLRTIYKGNGANNLANGPIHPGPPPTPTVNCLYPYDRDGLGGAWPATWPCVVAGPPPYEDLGPCPAGVAPKNLGSCIVRLPFNPDLPNETTYQQLKAIAKRTNTYCEPASCFAGGTGTLTIQNSDLPDPNTTKFFVLYVEGRDVSIAQSTQWGPQVRPPENLSPCTNHMGIVVVRNGKLTWNATEIWWGAAFVPEGEFSGGGGGGSPSPDPNAGAWVVGTVKADSIGSTGNIKFQLNNCWKVSMPGFNFSVTRERWHQPNQ